MTARCSCSTPAPASASLAGRSSGTTARSTCCSRTCTSTTSRASASSAVLGAGRRAAPLGPGPPPPHARGADLALRLAAALPAAGLRQPRRAPLPRRAGRCLADRRRDDPGRRGPPPGPDRRVSHRGGRHVARVHPRPRAGARAQRRLRARLSRLAPGFDVAAGATVLLHDAQLTEEEYAARVGWGHSSVDAAVAFARSTGAERLVLFHHDPMRGDDDVERLAAYAQSLWPSANGSSPFSPPTRACGSPCAAVAPRVPWRRGPGSRGRRGGDAARRACAGCRSSRRRRSRSPSLAWIPAPSAPRCAGARAGPRASWRRGGPATSSHSGRGRPPLGRAAAQRAHRAGARDDVPRPAHPSAGGDQATAETMFRTPALPSWIGATTTPLSLVVGGQPFFPRMVWKQCPWAYPRSLGAGINVFMGTGCGSVTAQLHGLAGRALSSPRRGGARPGRRTSSAITSWTKPTSTSTPEALPLRRRRG